MKKYWDGFENGIDRKNITNHKRKQIREKNYFGRDNITGFLFYENRSGIYIGI